MKLARLAKIAGHEPGDLGGRAFRPASSLYKTGPATTSVASPIMSPNRTAAHVLTTRSCNGLPAGTSSESNRMVTHTTSTSSNATKPATRQKRSNGRGERSGMISLAPAAA